MKRTSNPRLKVLLLLCLTIFTNCSKEDVVTDTFDDNGLIGTVSISEASDFLRPESRLFSIFSKSGNRPYAVPDLKGISHGKINNSDEMLTIVPARTFGKKVHSRILLLKIGDQIRSVVYSMVPGKRSTKDRFSGKIYIADLEGNFINGYRVKKGRRASRLVKPEVPGTTSKDITLKSLQMRNSADSELEFCPYPDPSWCELDEVVVTADSGSDWNDIYIPDIFYDYPWNDSNGYDPYDDYSWDDDDDDDYWDYDGGGYDSGNDNTSEEVIVGKDFADKYPCQVGITVDAVGICSPLTQLVLDIFEQDNDVNLIFDSSNQITGNGNTSSNIRYNPRTKQCYITVSLRESYLESGTDLSIAKTVIHESMHAVLVYMLFEGKFVTETGNPESGYEELMDGYVEYLITNDPAKYGNEQHEVIANLNRDIATSLSVYGQNNGYSLPFSYYETLSWGGLTKTGNFENKYPKYLSDGSINPEWKTINNTLAAEQNNSNNYRNGNGDTISPKGKPCN